MFFNNILIVKIYRKNIFSIYIYRKFPSPTPAPESQNAPVLHSWQPHNAWTVSSISLWHLSQIEFRVTFLISKFFFVGRDS